MPNFQCVQLCNQPSQRPVGCLARLCNHPPHRQRLSRHRRWQLHNKIAGPMGSPARCSNLPTPVTHTYSKEGALAASNNTVFILPERKACLCRQKQLWDTLDMTDEGGWSAHSRQTGYRTQECNERHMSLNNMLRQPLTNKTPAPRPAPTATAAGAGLPPGAAAGVAPAPQACTAAADAARPTPRLPHHPARLAPPAPPPAALPGQT